MLLVVMSDEELNRINKCEKLVLVSKTLANKYGLSEIKEKIEDSYDFGGEADIRADIVTHENHYFFAWLEDR